MCFEGAPDTALVTYEQPSSATRAFQSKKAIFDNRFVYVMYYTPSEQQEQVPRMGFAHHEQEAQSVKPKVILYYFTNIYSLLKIWTRLIYSLLFEQ